MWIDVQGFEGHAFLGAERLLARGIPAVSEIWPYAIRRSGMSFDDFSSLIKRFWTHAAIPIDQQSFRIIETSQLPAFLDELGEERDSNVIFFRKDWVRIIRGLLTSIRHRRVESSDARMASRPSSSMAAT